MKRTLIISGLILLVSSVYSQNESDGLLFSRGDVNGTARYTALGGAFTALGGDASGTWKNPAGVGVYRSNEFSLTGTYSEEFIRSNYYGNTSETGQGKLNIGSFSITGVQDLRQAGKWRNTAISFGMNRVAVYNENYTVEANGVNASILDDYTNEINEEGVDWYDLESEYPFDLYLLWENFLIDVKPGYTNQYYNTSGLSPVDHVYNVDIEGAKRETYFTFGGNYDDRLYIGVAVYTSNINYDKTTVYTESFDQSDTTINLDEFSQTFQEEIDGRGYSFSLGAIYRPVDALRLGLSLKSPELQNMEYSFESYNITVEDEVAYEVLSPVVIRDYRFRITSPFQSTLGLAYTFKKYGLISVEADYVDMRMTNMRGRTDSDPFTEENSATETLLVPTINLRAGLEYRVTSSIAARIGYAAYSNPYSDQVNSNGAFQIYSLGAGYRVDQFFVDASYQYRVSGERYTIYDPAMVDPIELAKTDHRITLTFGLKL